MINTGSCEVAMLLLQNSLLLMFTYIKKPKIVIYNEWLVVQL